MRNSGQRLTGFIAAAVLILGLFGCADSQYVAEKLFWQAQQDMKDIAAKGLANLTDADYDKIIRLHQNVVEACPLEPIAAKAQFVIADTYAAQGKYREAQAELLAIINNFSSLPELAARAQFNIGKLYESQGKWDKAREEYEKLMDLYPVTELGLNMPLYIIRYYQSVNDKKEEEKAYRQAIRHYSDISNEFAETDFSPVIQDYMASFYAGHGDYQEAIEAWKKTIFSFPLNPLAKKAFLAVAETYALGLNDLTSAIATYEAFIESYPKFERIAEIKVRLGLLCVTHNQLRRAKEIFEELIHDYPEDESTLVKAYAGLAQVYQAEKNTEKVVEVYETMKTRFPHSREVVSVPFLIAKYYEDLKFSTKADLAYNTAIVEYKAMLESDDRNEAVKREAANFLALCYIKKNDTENALQLLRMLAEKYPDNPMYLMDMASLYTNLNAVDKAIAVYRELMRRYPNNRLILSLAQSQITTLRDKLSP